MGKALWRAVIYQAMLDATEPMTPGRPRAMVSSHNEAVMWFAATATPTTPVTDFSMVCDLAGLDPHDVKSFVRRIMNGEIEFIRRRLNVILAETST